MATPQDQSATKATSSTPIAKMRYSDHVQSQIIAVHVTNDSTTKTFHLPSTMLHQSSAYFRGCLSNSFAEALSHEVTLPETDASTFALFVDWLAQPTPTMSSLTSSQCIDLWLLADRLLCDRLGHDCLGRLRSLHTITPGTTFGPDFRVPEEAKAELLLHITQSGQTASSSLRRWYIELVAKAMQVPTKGQLLMKAQAWSQLEKDVLNEVLLAIVRQHGATGQRTRPEEDGRHAAPSQNPHDDKVKLLVRTLRVSADRATALLRNNDNDIDRAIYAHHGIPAPRTR
ncbi:uncharacterized protein AB675_8146 [Cyphellophora attinorum]|uniref:BTB domain-containing protein n=1 Tax=Cyphellophora attinorum TaxID=1664694 RepID=A0A0N1H5T7_9EURO|nr:uncharacterized protein AB675_8146 [Phialophora attinorum]KPI41222.1 hypothetical protein AB675_8146 [Phialophora attinorum]